MARQFQQICPGQATVGVLSEPTVFGLGYDRCVYVWVPPVMERNSSSGQPQVTCVSPGRWQLLQDGNTE